MSAPNLHLSDEQIAWYADALHEKCIEELPDDIKKHVEECADCRENIFDIYEISTSKTGANNTTRCRNTNIVYPICNFGIKLICLILEMHPAREEG